MTAHAAPSSRHRLSLPEEPGRRRGTQSLLMVAATAASALVAGIIGTFLQVAVFDLEEQELLSDAGFPGYAAGLCLLALMVLPAIVGIALGARARRLGERSLGTAGMVVNALVATYLVFTVAATLVLG